MTSPYLDQPRLPLAVALPRMLSKIEADLAKETVSAADKVMLQQRAGLVRRLLPPHSAFDKGLAMGGTLASGPRSPA